MVDLTGIEPVTSSLRILSADLAPNGSDERKRRESQELDRKSAADGVHNEHR
jgi:hypothetical protein